MTEASQDAYELVQRQAIRFIAKNGDRRLIPALIRLSIANNTSDRCNFNVMTALACFPKEDLLAEFDRQFDAPSVQYLDKNNLRGKIRNTIAHSADRLTTDIDKVVKGEASEKRPDLHHPCPAQHLAAPQSSGVVGLPAGLRRREHSNLAARSLRMAHRFLPCRRHRGDSLENE